MIIRIFRIVLASLCYCLGFVLAIYVGGFLMLYQPLCTLIRTIRGDSFTAAKLILDLLMIAASATVAGAIWCIGYMISNRIYDKRDE